MERVKALFKRSAVLNLLDKVSFNSNTITLQFIPNRNGIMHITFNEIGVITQVQMPRVMFPRFKGNMITSNFKTKRDNQMMNALGLFYNRSFMILMIKELKSTVEDTKNEEEYIPIEKVWED